MTTVKRAASDAFLREVTELFVAYCRDSQLAVITTEADKYGSLVWECGRSDGLNRYLTLACTVEESGPSDSVPVDFEIIIAADNGKRYTRSTVYSERLQFPVTSAGAQEALSDTSSDIYARLGKVIQKTSLLKNWSEFLQSVLAGALVRARQQLLEIGENSLTEDYPFPRAT